MILEYGINQDIQVEMDIHSMKISKMYDEGKTPFFLAPGSGNSNRSHLAERI